VGARRPRSLPNRAPRATSIDIVNDPTVRLNLTQPLTPLMASPTAPA
jgi:hypothetical protein